MLLILPCFVVLFFFNKKILTCNKKKNCCKKKGLEKKDQPKPKHNHFFQNHQLSNESIPFFLQQTITPLNNDPTNSQNPSLRKSTISNGVLLPKR